MNNNSRPLRHAKKILRMPHELMVLEERVQEIHEHFLALNHEVHTHEETLGALGKQRADGHEDMVRRLRLLDDRLTDALHQISVLQEQVAESGGGKASAVKGKAKDDALVADEHLLDNFYVEFERWCRGDEAEIKYRQQVYLPYFTGSKLDSKKTPVLDIGCGRGEFVQLLHENHVRAIGLDINKAMIERLKEKGIEGVQGDALEYLQQQKSGSLMAVTGFHLVEHIPFAALMRLFNECYRVLAPGGFVIFETPNPENMVVGSYSFYMDPSHLHPLPPPLLELALKTRGFPKTEIKRLHPLKAAVTHDDPLVKEMAERFFGAQDYAVIATK